MFRPSDALSDIRWLPFRNDSGETAPAFGVMRITGAVAVEGQTVITIAKPNTAFANVLVAPFVLINAGFDVADGAYGSGTLDLPTFALYDSADGTPNVGEAWGPENGSWKLNRKRIGFLTLGGLTTDNRVGVVRSVVGTVVRIGKLVTALSAGGTATMNLWDASPGPDLEVVDATVYSVADWCLGPSESIAAGKKIIVALIQGHHYCVAAEC